MGIVIKKDLCIGCGACTGACGAGALEISAEGYAVVNDNCVMCGMCVDACPVEAISLENLKTATDKALLFTALTHNARFV